MELFDSHLAAEPGTQEPPTVVPWEKSCKTVPCWALNAPTAAPWQCCTARSRITKIEFLEAPLKSFFARQQPQVSLRSYSHYSKKRIPKALQAWKTHLLLLKPQAEAFHTNSHCKHRAEEGNCKIHLRMREQLQSSEGKSKNNAHCYSISSGFVYVPYRKQLSCLSAALWPLERAMG